jgi:hypothetical protein
MGTQSGAAQFMHVFSEPTQGLKMRDSCAYRNHKYMVGVATKGKKKYFGMLKFQGE